MEGWTIYCVRPKKKSVSSARDAAQGNRELVANYRLEIEGIDFLSTDITHKKRRAIRSKAAPGNPGSNDPAKVFQAGYALETDDFYHQMVWSGVTARSAYSGPIPVT